MMHKANKITALDALDYEQKLKRFFVDTRIKNQIPIENIAKHFNISPAQYVYFETNVHKATIEFIMLFNNFLLDSSRDIKISESLINKLKFGNRIYNLMTQLKDTLFVDTNRLLKNFDINDMHLKCIYLGIEDLSVAFESFLVSHFNVNPLYINNSLDNGPIFFTD